ncbi:unnamed protein product [Linum trigynum]|uniref:Uncharacterized protein n=1 Tax=Linum trigynum TaxID=586398 RepID=A0AAV2DCM1_9ROSI
MYATGLALAAAPITDAKLVTLCLHGLGPDYHEFFAAIHPRDSGPPIEDLERLVTLEADLRVTKSDSPATAFATQCDCGCGRHGGSAGAVLAVHPSFYAPIGRILGLSLR